MKNIILNATFLIALCSAYTGASAAEVYKCGNNYSQSPCPDAVRLDVQDARTPAQKAESEANVRREAATANAMERARLKEEARQRAVNAKKDAKQGKKASTKPHTAASAPATDPASTASSKSKRKKGANKKKKDPEFFTASVPTDKPKPQTVAKPKPLP